MTPEEAIKRLTDGDDFDYQSGCHCPECTRNKPVIDLAIEALKRMKPTFTVEREYIAHEYDDQPYLTIHCPNCDMTIGGSSSKRFCEYCGQSLLWGDE